MTSEADTQQTDSPAVASDRGLTTRSVILGIIVIAVVNIWIAGSEYIVHASRMNLSHYPLALFVAFLVTVVPLNVVLRLINPQSMLSPSELMTVVAMGLVGAAVPASGLTAFFLGVIATPFYYASPENQWGLYMHEYIADWLAPRDEGSAMRWFFDGLPPGARAPWEVWIVPLIWWLMFLAVVFFVSLCLAVILRKQWSVHERLVYPLATVAAEVTEGSQEWRFWPTFMRGKLFWYGFLLSFGLLAWNMVAYFWPTMPTLPIQGRWLSFGRDFPTMHIRVNFFTIGFAYFANPEVLSSIWIFFIVFVLQAGIFNRVGFTIGRIEDQWSNYDAANSWQNFGAFLFFVLWGLWIARKHLWQVVLKAVRNDPDIDDRDEMLSYRVAFFGFLFGNVFILCWLKCAGMEFKLSILWLFGTIVTFIGVARIVAESGLIYVRGPLSAQSFGCYILGSDALTPGSLTALAFTYTLIANGRALFMTSLVHAARIGQFLKANKRRLAMAVCLGVLVGTMASIIVTIYLGYQQGAANFQDVPFSGLCRSVFRDTVNKMKNPFSTSWPRLGFFAGGFVVMGLLTVLRHVFTWWPLHPIGFAISCTYLIRRSVFSIFIAWVCKAVILQVGGVGLYRRSKPFFLGLLTGYAFGVAASFLVDAIWFCGMGHCVHSW